MKIKSLFLVSIICFFSTCVFAEETAAVTGLCKDGTPYTGKTKRGACRGHDGVKEWYGDKGTATTATAPATSAATPAPTATNEKPVETTVPSAAATGMCKDGTPFTGQTKRGACRGHKGLKEWYADKAPAAEVAPAPAPAEATPVAEPAKTVAPATPAPAAEPAAAKSAPQPAAPVQAPPAGSGKVWVNTRSKIYHCEGSKFYGHTKEGGYMTEADAQAKGYVANRKKVCNK